MTFLLRNIKGEILMSLLFVLFMENLRLSLARSLVKQKADPLMVVGSVTAWYHPMSERAEWNILSVGCTSCMAINTRSYGVISKEKSLKSVSLVNSMASNTIAQMCC